MVYRYLPTALVVGAWAILVGRSYFPGSRLLGWDNFAIEIDPLLNLKRLLSGVWQEYQGVGLLGGMGHVADLTRITLLWPLSGLVPEISLRWVWVMAMLIVGPLGAYTLILCQTKNRVSALVGSLFYLLNPATIQTFVTPLESFVGFYAFLPWLVWSALSYLQNGTGRKIRTYLMLSLIATSAFVVQTLFIVYAMILGILGLGYLLRSKNYHRVVKLLLTTLIGNAFWLLPVVYSAVTQANIPLLARANRLATHEVELMNQKYGDLSSIVTLKGWWLSTTDFDHTGLPQLLISRWTEWLAHPAITMLGFLVFVAVLIGLIRSRKYGYLAILSVAFLILGTRIPGINHLYVWLTDVVPLLGQLFRAGFTKWATVVILVYSVGLGYLISHISRYSSKAGKILAGLIVGVMCAMVFPAFQSGVINDSMKVNLPDAYPKLFKFMQSQDASGRIVNLPVESLWGWNYHDWGYRGSGFVWYGIEQPILDRAFDVWSQYNEGFYNEFVKAFYGKDTELLHTVLRKYNVRYAILDETVIIPGQDKAWMRYDEYRDVLTRLGAKEIWREGKIAVWDLGERGNNFVSAPAKYSSIQADTRYARHDVIYEELGTYISAEEGWQYPLAHLLREEVPVEYTGTKAWIRTDTVGGTLRVPGLAPGTPVEMSYTVSLDEGGLTIDFEPIYLVDEAQGAELADIHITVPISDSGYWVQMGKESTYLERSAGKVSGNTTLTTGEQIEIGIYEGRGTRENVTTYFRAEETQTCWQGVGEHVAQGKQIDDATIQYSVNNAAACLAIPLTPQRRNSLLLTDIAYRSESGVRPDMCLNQDGDEYICENKPVYQITPASQNWQSVRRALLVRAAEKYWLDLIVRQPTGSTQTALIEYQTPSIIWYPLISTFTVPADIWLPVTEERSYTAGNGKLLISTTSVPHRYDLSSLGRLIPDNCDVLDRGIVTKSESDGKTVYWADNNGAACDSVDASDLSARIPYLVRVRGEGVQGRSQKLNIQNNGNPGNVLEYLMDKGSFDHSLTLLPWSFEGTYTLNAETRSFGELTENVWEQVEVRYFPLDQISRAKITPSETEPQVSDLQVQDVKKTGTWLYQITSEGSGLLRVAQGFDNGWIAWGRGGRHELLEHVTVDGWANGWLVNGEKQIIIIYWPQLLEFAGLGLLPILFWLLGFKKVARF